MHDTSWLLLIHQIPAKPDYLRVKIGRRLQQVGAVGVKSSVYALPDTAAAREDLQWILREVTGAGGEAVLCAVDLIDGLDDAQLRAMFQEVRGKDYQALAAEIAEASRALDSSADASSPPSALGMLARLERRRAAVDAIDFFGAPGRDRAAAELGELRSRLMGRRGAPRSETVAPRPAGATWVTRPGVEEDRIASAWLIRRFIDPAARFRFSAEAAGVDTGEIRFDMFEAEFTHDGDRCTFEVLLDRFSLDDRALEAIAEVVHDIDLADDKFGRPETAGVERTIRGLLRVEPEDSGRLRAGTALFDALYAAFGGNR